MSAHKHTSEWQVSRLTPSRVDTPDGSISVSWSSNADGGERNRKAEKAARLIAAAPELLEALRLAMEWNWLDDDARPSRVAEICDAAIAKATGESA